MPVDPKEEGRWRSESISSRFIDWVQNNPLDLKRPSVREISIENYSINTDTGQMEGTGPSWSASRRVPAVDGVGRPAGRQGRQYR